MKRIRLSALALIATSLLVFTSCKKEEYNLYTTLAGAVLDASNGEPLAAVTVTVSPSGKSYVTGSNGTFEFIDMDAQQYTISAQKTGYATNRVKVTGVAGETVEATISLTKNE